MPTINVESMADRYGKNRTRFKPMLVGVVLLAIMLVGVIAFYVVSGSDILTHYTPEEQLVIDLIEENEGDPDSVEMIALEGPRWSAGTTHYRVKYRARNVFGGRSVYDRCLSIKDGVASYSPSNNKFIVAGWNGMNRTSARDSLREWLTNEAEHLVFYEALGRDELKAAVGGHAESGFTSTELAETDSAYVISGPYRLNSQKTVRTIVTFGKPESDQPGPVVEFVGIPPPVELIRGPVETPGSRFP